MVRVKNDVEFKYKREEDEVVGKLEGGLKSTLLPLQELSIREGEGSHRIIEGDNLYGLRSLSDKGETFDVILIDVPYNTLDIRLTYKDRRGDDGGFSEWMSFLEPRLMEGYKMLDESGLMIIHINDRNAPYLTLLCDKLYGIENRLPTITWKTSGGINVSRTLKVVTETILIYTKGETPKFKRREPLSGGKIERDRSDYMEDGVLVYRSLDDYRKMEKGNKCPSLIKRSSTRYQRNRDYRLVDPDGGYYYLPGGVDGYEKRKKLTEEYLVKNRTPFFEMLEGTVKERIKKGEIFWVYDEVNKEWDLKKREVKGSKNNAYPTLLDSTDFQGVSSKKGFYDLVGVLPDAQFSYPKPVNLEKILISLRGKKEMKVLDYFGGSGTTLIACLELNSEGYKIDCTLMTDNENNICREVAYERARRVIGGYDNRGKFVNGLGGSLDYYISEVEIENMR